MVMLITEGYYILLLYPGYMTIIEIAVHEIVLYYLIKQRYTMIFFVTRYLILICICCLMESRRMRWVGHVARMGEGRNVYRVLVGKPEGKIPLERPRRRWEDGIKMDLREIGWGGVEWIHLAEDRDRWRAVVNAVMNLRVLAPRS
jgi:hypothetical protein